jgi:adenine-specific DNA-methyltransferase
MVQDPSKFFPRVQIGTYMFYPILIDEKNKKVVRSGPTLPYPEKPNFDLTIDGYKVAWPVRMNMTEGYWSVSAPTLDLLISKGYVSLGGFDKKRNTWAISYLNKKSRAQIVNGEILITGRNERTGVVNVEYSGSKEELVRTVWYRPLHNAGTNGSDLLTAIIGKSKAFSFPKSVYSEHDAIGQVVKDNKSALIVDFFAGSGTTLNAVNLLNEEDGGHRRCIMVTNNEVSDEESKLLSSKGLFPGEEEWEKLGICQAVTWPRTKYTVRGSRDDGTKLDGSYEVQMSEPVEHQINYLKIDLYDRMMGLTDEQISEFLSLIHVKKKKEEFYGDYLISETYGLAALFRPEKIDDFLAKVEDVDGLNTVYIFAKDQSDFVLLKEKIISVVGENYSSMDPIERPMSEGFKTNVEYLRLDFLNKDSISLGDSLDQLFVLLWMQAGCVGKRPNLPRKNIDMYFDPNGSFALLVDETKYSEFLNNIKGKSYKFVYLVTNSDSSFAEMASKIASPNIKQLYRNYLDNFVICSRGK